MGFQRAPLEFIGKLFKTYGDVCAFRLATTRIVALNHPADLKRVLQKNSSNYNRTAAAHAMARNLFGNGLSMMEGGGRDGGEWRGRRRLMQPSFHYQRVAAMSGFMLDVIGTSLARWQAVAAARESMDAGTEMRRLTLGIVAKALFGIEDEETVRRFAGAVDQVGTELSAYMQLPLLPLKVPTPGHRRFWSNLETMDGIINDTIAAHARAEAGRFDMLSMLIESADEETGARLTHKELRDEAFALLFAGHETSANVLTWVCYRLGLHPDVQERVQQEVDHELGGDPPAFADTTKLEYTHLVLQETMRLYPQQWQGWRHAIDEDVVGDYRIAPGSDIFFSPYHAHRHPEIWDDPESFQPGRFTPERAARRDPSTYLPFGAGPHACIGQQFATSEMLLIVASLVQRFRIELTTPAPIEPRPLITLGPERPVLVRLRARS